MEKRSGFERLSGNVVGNSKSDLGISPKSEQPQALEDEVIVVSEEELRKIHRKIGTSYTYSQNYISLYSIID